MGTPQQVRFEFVLQYIWSDVTSKHLQIYGNTAYDGFYSILRRILGQVFIFLTMEQESVEFERKTQNRVR